MSENILVKKFIAAKERRYINIEDDDDTVEFGDPASGGEMFGVYNDENSGDSGIGNTDDEECVRRRDFIGEKNAPRLGRCCINFEDVDCVSLGSLFTPTSKLFGMDDDEKSRDRGISETHSKEFTIEQDSIGKHKQSCMNGKNQYSQRFFMRKSKTFKSRKCLSESLACDLDASISKRNQFRKVNHRHRMDVVDTLAEGEDLVGDGSAAHQLPTIPGKHKDLKSVSSQTVKDVIEGAYKDVIDNYVIVDCRYPYEYDGGHIEGAENLYTRDMVVERFLSNVNSSEKTVVIFHCEFSSERGPKLLRHLRGMDRQVNAENYPRLHYPEIYLLHGGYKEFFQHEKEFCVPQQYRPMLDKEHSADLRHFRTKSKSWQAGERRKCLRF